MCKAYGCGDTAQTTVLNEHGSWGVCFKHINVFDVWDEGRSAPVDWEWTNGGRSRFQYMADAGLLPTRTWVTRIGGQFPDRYSEVYRWLLQNVDTFPPHLNRQLMKEFIRLYFRYAEFGINSFDDHFRDMVEHPLFDVVEFMKVFLETVKNHELGRRTLRQMFSGPCKPLVYMNGDAISDTTKYHMEIMDTYTMIRQDEKRRWQVEMKERLGYKEDLIAKAWHPNRIERWLEAGWMAFID